MSVLAPTVIVAICWCLLSCLESTEGKFTSLSGLYSDVCQSPGSMGGISDNNNIRVFNPDIADSDLNAPYKQRELIVSSFEKNMVFWAVNLLESLSKLARPLEKAGLPVDHVEVIFIVFDDATLELCDSLRIPCWYPRDMFALPPPPLEDSKSVKKKGTQRRGRGRGGGISMSMAASPFHIQAVQRLQATALLLGAGANVLLTETDVYWLRSPYPIVAKRQSDIHIPSKLSNNGAGILYARGTEDISNLFRKSYDHCLHEVGTHHRFSCIRHAIGRHENTSFLGATAFPADGCSWNDMSSAEQHSAYMFYGRCKAASTAKGHGLLATLQFYDHQGMLNLNFLHEWLTSRPAESASPQKQPKRMYVGDAVPADSNNGGQAGAGDRTDSTMFHSPLRACSRIQQELVSISKRSSSLKEFLEQAALHRSDLLR